jgi:hypothetical protein
LDSLVAKRPSTFFTYQFSADPYPAAQDAAKFFVPAGALSSNIPIAQQLWFPIPTISTGSIVLTWDWYWGPEFRANRGGMNFYKMFQVEMGGHGWWTLMHGLSYASAPGEAARISDSFRTGFFADPSQTKREPWERPGPGAVTPQWTFPIYDSRWTRYWIEIKFAQPPGAFTEFSEAYLGGVPVRPNAYDPQGRWVMVSQWIADERRPPTRILYRVPAEYTNGIGWDAYVQRFRFEMNTSQSKGFIGPWIGYGRNVVVLHNYALPRVPETDRLLFQQPVR